MLRLPSSYDSEQHATIAWSLLFDMQNSRIYGMFLQQQSTDTEPEPETGELDAATDHYRHLRYPLYIPQQERICNEAHVYFRPKPIPGKYSWSQESLGWEISANTSLKQRADKVLSLVSLQGWLEVCTKQLQ